MDSWIYRYYSLLINEAYNKRVKIDNINNVAVAYRTDLGKSNIQFAKEAFDNIRKNEFCYILVGDFTDFFDNLNHSYLKSQLCNLLEVSKLPSDYYAVFKNITRFSYIELVDLLAFNGLDDNKKGRRDFNKITRERAMSPIEFRNNKHLLKSNPNGKRGIPQGSPISAVLANVYMLSADKQIQEYVSSLGGYYLRYSDDFIIIIPQRTGCFQTQITHIKSLLEKVPDLQLKDSKTRVYRFCNTSICDCTEDYIANGENGKDLLEFLGFSFDGQTVRIRAKTVSKYYNKLYRKIKTIVRNKGYTRNNNRISARNLYRVYSYKGSRGYLKRKAAKTGIQLTEKQQHGNFLDYLTRAKRAFGNELVDTIGKRHMQKIKKQLKAIKQESPN